MKKLLTYSMFALTLSSGQAQGADNFFQALANFFTTLAESATPKTDPKYTLTRKQVDSYVHMYITSIKQTLYPAVSQTDMNQLTKKINHGMSSRSDLYIWIQGVRWYDKEKIDQIILSAMLEIIEENSYIYALKQTNNKVIAQKVAQSMYNNALAITQKTSILDPAKLRPFFGAALHQAIRKAITQFDAAYQQSFTPSAPAVQLYPSSICCICLNDFSTKIERIFLYPCGHDMCKFCALEYFFEDHGNSKTCPQCRSIVNLEQLFEDLGI